MIKIFYRHCLHPCRDSLIKWLNKISTTTLSCPLKHLDGALAPTMKRWGPRRLENRTQGKVIILTEYPSARDIYCSKWRQYFQPPHLWVLAMHISNFFLFTNLQSSPGSVGTCNIWLVNQLYDTWHYSPFMSNYETQIVAGITVIDVSFSGTSFDNSYDLTFCVQCKQHKSFTWIWSRKRLGQWQRIRSVRGSWRGEQGTKWVPWNSSHF